MPTLSVKLSDAVKSRIDKLVTMRGTTAHAFMVEAIELQLDNEERHDAFVQAALDAHDEMVESGRAYDGDEFLAYMRAKVHGASVPRPRLKSLKSLAKKKPD